MSNSTQVIYENHHQNAREEGFSIMEKERGELLAELVGTAKKVLDIGCRDGALTRHFIQANRVLGVDIDTHALAKAKNNLGIEARYVDLNGDWSELNGELFDVVVAGEVLEHLYYPEEVSRKVKSHLNQGGVFVGSVPNAFSFKNRLRYLLGQKRHTPLSDPTHINQFSYADLKHTLSKHFKRVEVIGLGRYSRLSRHFPNAIAFDLFFKASD